MSSGLDQAKTAYAVVVKATTKPCIGSAAFAPLVKAMLAVAVEADVERLVLDLDLNGLIDLFVGTDEEEAVRMVTTV